MGLPDLAPWQRRALDQAGATLEGRREASTFRLDGGRAAVRSASVAIALDRLIVLAAPTGTDRAD